MREITIDATGLVLGRLASYVAKQALSGHSVEIVNVDKVVVSGNPQRVISVYRKRREMTNYANPERASKWPRRPDYLFKKILSGMLPNTARGKRASSRVKSHIGNENNKTGIKPVKDSTSIKGDFISFAELCKALGWAHG